MSRSYNEDNDWDYARQCLWDNAVRRATHSKRGQKVLRDVEAALLALPEKRLIEGQISDGTGVCFVGALDAHRRVLEGADWQSALTAMHDPDYDPEDDYETVDDTARWAEQHLKMAFSLAWDMAFWNDHIADRLSPEERWTAALRWVRTRIDEMAS